MNYADDELREAAERVGLSFDYLKRLTVAAEYDPQDPRGGNTLGKQLTVIFDHHLAKCLADPDPVASLRQFGFVETADAMTRAQRSS